MTLKRVFGLLLCSALAIGSLSAADPKKVPLDIMAYGDNSSPEGQLIGQTIEAFTAANPNIELTFSVSFNDPFHEKARARVAGKNAPDVIYLWPGSRSGYIYNAGLGVDYSKYVDKAKFLPAALAPQGPKGEVWEVPMGLTTSSVLFMNKALLADLGLKEPKTYADLVALVAPLKAKGIAVISFAGSQDWVYNSCLVSTLVGRFTGEANWVKGAVEGKFRFTDKGFVDALAFMKKMFDDGVISPASIANDYGASLAQFLSGKALFTLDGDWRAGGMAEDGFDANVSLGILPALPGERLKNSTSVVGATGYGMTKQALRDPAITTAAQKFIDFFNSEAEATKRLVEGVSTTSLVSLSKNPPAATSLLMKARLALTASVVGVDVMDNFIPEQAMAPFATGMVNIVLGKATPAAVAADLEKNVRAVQKK